MTWVTVASLAAVCFALRAAVPLLLRDRGLPPAVERRLGYAIPPLLAALAATQLVTPAPDARAAGVAAGAAVFLWRRSLLLALVAAAAVTGVLRAALG